MGSMGVMDERRAQEMIRRESRRLARQIAGFGAAHGGSAEATVEYLGARGVRIVLVGADGQWGDLVARTPEAAADALASSGVTVHDDFGGAFAARLRTGPYEWTRMAGIQIGGPANT